MIYLISPYTSPHADVREGRYQLACRAVTYLLRNDRLVFSPVVHFHPTVQWGLPTTWDYWQRIDTEFLKLCDEVVVFAFPGWEFSQGMQAEVRIAKELGKPIEFLKLKEVVDNTPLAPQTPEVPG